MNRRVLVIDNEQTVLKFLQLTLKKAGYDVSAATDRSQAEKVLASEAADSDVLLVVDVALDKESGITLASDLARRFPRSRILFISGFADDVVLVNGSDLQHRTTFLQKPFSPEALVETVGRISKN